MINKLSRGTNRTLILGLVKKLIFNIYQIGSKKKFRILEQQSKGIKLSLGSGPVAGVNGWITVDRHGCDICWDLRRGIPVSSGTVDEIYTSHLLEHLDYSSIVALLLECKRVLKPEGCMSVCVPDARRYITAYIEKKEFQPRESYYRPALVDTGSYLDQVNYIAYLGGEHQFMFDQESLVNIFIKCGFASASPRQYGHELDRLERDFQSIYCIANKT